MADDVPVTKLNVPKSIFAINIIYKISLHVDGSGILIMSMKTIYLLYYAINMVVDALMTDVARASTAMIMTS